MNSDNFIKFIDNLHKKITDKNDVLLLESVKTAYKLLFEYETKIDKWKIKFDDLWDGTQIFIVDGEYVRNNVAVKFIEGGHCLVYPDFIPKNEIWIEQMLNSYDQEAIATHEIYEYTLMKYLKYTYDDAHDRANNVEKIIRSLGLKAHKENKHLTNM